MWNWAESDKILQNWAKSGKIGDNSSESCKMQQKHSIFCRIIQNYAELFRIFVLSIIQSFCLSSVPLVGSLGLNDIFSFAIKRADF